MANKISAAKRKPGPHGRTEYPLYETMYVLCPSARYVGGTSIYLCECARPQECLGQRAAQAQAAAERTATAKAQPLIIRNTLHIEDHNGTLVLYGRCLRGDFLRLGEVKTGTQPRVQQDELAGVFDFCLLERPDFMDDLIARMREKHPRDLKWEVTPAAPEPTESLAQYELKDRREVYGNDQRAMNRHSVRHYEYKGLEFRLDKNLSIIPPCYQLYYFSADRYPLSTSVIVDGEEHWGSGLTWGQAEIAALAALKQLLAKSKPKAIPAPEQPPLTRWGTRKETPASSAEDKQAWLAEKQARWTHPQYPQFGLPGRERADSQSPRLTPRAPRALDYGEAMHSEDLVLGDTSRILDFGDGPYRLCQDSQDVYDVLQGIGQPQLMAEYDGLFVRENEDEDAPPAEVWGFNGTPRHEKQAELVYMARLDARLPGNAPVRPVDLKALPSVGPFMGVTADQVKELSDGRKFRCIAYGAYNAQGLINKQSGVAILDQATHQVLCDQINCGCGPAQGVAMLLSMSDQDFVAFVNGHARSRYRI